MANINTASINVKRYIETGTLYKDDIAAIQNEAKRLAKAYLESVACGDLKPARPEVGICSNLCEYLVTKLGQIFIYGNDIVKFPIKIGSIWNKLGNILDEIANRLSYHLVLTSCQDWEHYSGHEIFPVPGSKQQEAILGDRSRWTGVNLEYRLDLCRHLAKKVDSYDLRPDDFVSVEEEEEV